MSDRLAVKYLFLANDGLADHSKAVLESFDATHGQNDYEVSSELESEHVSDLELYT